MHKSGSASAVVYAAALECQCTNYIEQSFEKSEMKASFFKGKTIIRTLSISLILEMLYMPAL